MHDPDPQPATSEVDHSFRTDRVEGPPAVLHLARLRLLRRARARGGAPPLQLASTARARLDACSSRIPSPRFPTNDSGRARPSSGSTSTPDVLPMWVAEMDVDLADPIKEALDEALPRQRHGIPRLDALRRVIRRLRERPMVVARSRRRVGPPRSRRHSRLYRRPAARRGARRHRRRHVARVPAVLLVPARGGPHGGRGASHRRDEARPGDDRRRAWGRDGRGRSRRRGAAVQPPQPRRNAPHSRRARDPRGRRRPPRRRRRRRRDPRADRLRPARSSSPTCRSTPRAWRSTRRPRHGTSRPSPPRCSSSAPRRRRKRDVFKAGAHHWPTHFGAIAQTAAYREGGPWLDALMAGLDANRKLLGDLLAAHLPTVGYLMPEATYLAWLDCSALGLGDDPAAVFLERGRVALNSGPTFGTGGAGHVRLNFATRPDLLEEGVRRMAASRRLASRPEGEAPFIRHIARADVGHWSRATLGTTAEGRRSPRASPRAWPSRCTSPAAAPCPPSRALRCRCFSPSR